MKLNSKGFTMIELLVVLLIIGVLAAVATPMYLANTNRARAAEAVATMGMIRQAEREYFVKHNAYLSIASTVLDNDPGDATTPGLGIDVGTPQYFGNAAYVVTTGATSGRFTNPVAVDFIIYVNGATVDGTHPAIKDNEVATFNLEMDNSGRIYVNYGTGWVEY